MNQYIKFIVRVLLSCFYCLFRCNNTGCMRITTLCMGMAVGHFYNGALLA